MSVNAPTVQSEGSPKKVEKTIHSWQYVVAACGVLGFILIAWLAPVSAGLTQAGKTTLGILFLMLTWWISEITSVLVTGFLGMVLMLLFNVTDMPTIFSGFSSNVFIFMIFAFAIAVAVQKTGLGKRLAYSLIARSKPSFRSIMVSLVLVGFVLGAIIPLANACTVVLGTIGMMILPVFGQSEDKKSNVGRSIFTMLGFTTYITSQVYLAGLSAILVSGLLAKAGLTMNYLQWFVAFAPQALVVCVLLALIIPMIFPPEVKVVSVEKYREFQATLHGLGPMTTQEKKAAIVVGVTLVLWMIGSFIKLSLITAGVLGGVLLMFPGIGVLNGDDFSKKIPWEAVFFTGFCLTLGSVLPATGITKFLANLAHPVLGSSSLLVFCLKVWVLANLVHLILPAPQAAAATFVPVLIASAQAQHFSILIPVVVFLASYTAAIMVYQQTQTVIAFGFKQFNSQDLLKPGFVTAALWLLMTPLTVLYLTAIGH